MIIHVIRNNETIDQIINEYRVNMDDIIGNNFHITDFKKLKPGMRLFIPMINSEVLDVLKISEPFCDSKMSLFDKPDINNLPKENIPVVEILEENDELNDEVVIDNQIHDKEIKHVSNKLDFQFEEEIRSDTITLEEKNEINEGLIVENLKQQEKEVNDNKEDNSKDEVFNPYLEYYKSLGFIKKV